MVFIYPFTITTAIKAMKKKNFVFFSVLFDPYPRVYLQADVAFFSDDVVFVIVLDNNVWVFISKKNEG